MERWVGRVALVTGASVGIGAGICRELLKKGMIVVGCDKRVDKIQDIAKEEMFPYAQMLHAIHCDFEKEEEILAMYAEIKNKFGRLDVCINNVYNNSYYETFSRNTCLVSGDKSNWRYSLKVGIMGMLISTQEALKLMKEAKIDDGQIIQIGSAVGHMIPSLTVREPVPTPWFHMYKGIKAMIRALCEGLRQELKAIGSNIRVAFISPGSVESDYMSVSTGMRGIDYLVARLRSRYRMLQPKDIADVVTYILSTPPYVNVNDVINEALDLRIQSWYKHDCCSRLALTRVVTL